MTPQEQQMIDDLVQRIRNTQLAEKDTDAEQRLQQGLAGYPDAVYVLAQTVLVQKYGLEQAQQQLQAQQEQIDALQQQLQQQPKKSGSFLGNLLGMNEPAPQQPPPYQPVNAYGYPPPGYAQAPTYAQPMGYPAPSGGGFLRNAMQTAAGVAAGEMMFQGMESLFHGFGGGAGYGEGRPTEVINNNYYDDDHGHEHREETSSDASFYDPAHDASREDDTAQNDLSDTTDTQGFDDVGDDGAYDDNSSSGDDGSF